MILALLLEVCYLSNHETSLFSLSTTSDTVVRTMIGSLWMLWRSGLTLRPCSDLRTFRRLVAQHPSFRARYCMFSISNSLCCRRKHALVQGLNNILITIIQLYFSPSKCTNIAVAKISIRMVKYTQFFITVTPSRSGYLWLCVCAKFDYIEHIP